MNEQQRECLNRLNQVLIDASDCGLFDYHLPTVILPDIINQFCDAVGELHLQEATSS